MQLVADLLKFLSSEKALDPKRMKLEDPLETVHDDKIGFALYQPQARSLAKPRNFVGRGPALVHDAKTCAWCGFHGDELKCSTAREERQLIAANSKKDLAGAAPGSPSRARGRR